VNVAGVERKLAALVLLAFVGRAALRELKRSADPLAAILPLRRSGGREKGGQVEGVASSLFNFCFFLQCFDAVGWAAGRASGL